MQSIEIDGKMWAQANLFNGVWIDDLYAVCPDGLCDGSLTAGFPDSYAYDLTGWTLASIDEVNTLFNYYIESERNFMGPGPDVYYEAGMRNMFDYGWEPMYGREYGNTLFLRGYLRTSETGYSPRSTGFYCPNPCAIRTGDASGSQTLSEGDGALQRSDTGAFIYRSK